jgi:pullulanase/glycogen debranching enzyme
MTRSPASPEITQASLEASVLTDQQAAVAAIQSQDGYNWGYDPVHYMTPEGSYAIHPDQRVREYRTMVQGLPKLLSGRK